MADTAEICRRKCCQIGFCSENKATNICDGCKIDVFGKCTLKIISVSKNCTNES